MKYLILLFLLWMGQLSVAESGNGTAVLRPVTFDNDTLRYLGRVVREQGRLGLYWAACGVEITCKTTTFALEIDSDASDNYIQIVIDDEVEHPIVLPCTTGRKLYKIADSLSDTFHRFTVRRRTDPTTLGCFLYRVWVDEGAGLKITPAKKLKIAYYGDSVSSGHGDEAVEEGDDPVDRLFWNPTRAFTGYSAQLLDADYSIISKSGIGLMISWYDQVLGDLYDLQNPHDDNSKHDFKAESPEVIVVNVMQNDFWLLPKLNPQPDAETIIRTYSNFVGKLQGVYPEARIICALGPMNIVAPGSPWPEYVRKSVERLQENNRDGHITCCIFPYLPTKDHPTVKEHEIAARLLAAHIKRLFPD